MTETKQQTQNSIVRYMGSPLVEENIKQTLKDNAQDFMVSVAALVNSSPALQECTPKSVLSACLVATGLGLPINNNLGLAHIIPYNNKVKTMVDGKEVTSYEKQAQFQMAAKGFKQLAIRTGKYKNINDTDVREGEYAGKDRMTGEDKFDWFESDVERDTIPIIGYLAYFKLNTGYEKTLYMTVDQLKKHGMRYSKSFAKGYGNWKDDFDSMARKTVIKLLISRHGLLSTKSDDEIRLAKALEADQMVMNQDAGSYADNEKLDPKQVAEEKERERLKKHILNATSTASLDEVLEFIKDDEELEKLYKERSSALLATETPA